MSSATGLGDEGRVCPACGTRLPQDNPGSQCPVCLLRSAMNRRADDCRVVSDRRYAEQGLLPSMEERVFEHYEILVGPDGHLQELGRGAMGVTYKALDINLGRPVAIKLLNPRLLQDEVARQRFLREARAAAKVRHPNVASVYHLGSHGQEFFYAMEFVEGESLADHIKREGPLDPKHALEIAEQAAAGLAAIHKEQLVHRDIKPSNVMLSQDENGNYLVKLIDLGLAKAIGATRSDASLSGGGVFVGTPHFASPEQCSGGQVDIRSDIYSLGVTLWEMITGHVPFDGTTLQVMNKHQTAELPVEQLARRPKSVVQLLEKFLEKNPAKRPQNPAEAQTAINDVLATLGSGNRSRKSLPPRESRRNKRLLVLGSLFTAVVIGASLIAFLKPSTFMRPGLLESGDAEKGIAVLPFENLSTDPASAYFADGVQDDLLTNLAKIADLKVIGRTSVLRYRDAEKRNLGEIANNLGVANLLEGTVRREGNRVRISARLVHANNSQTLWADNFDKELTDVFAVQSEIAQTIAGRLRARLSQKEKNAIMEQPTRDPVAYNLYVQAKRNSSLYFPGDPNESLLQKIGLLREAIHRDPDFALAYADLSKLYVTQIVAIGGTLGTTAERRTLAEGALNEAIRLRPDLAETQLAKASYLLRVGKNAEEARAEAVAAVQQSPNNIDGLETLGEIEIARDHWDEALKLYERAASLDPENLDLLQNWAIYCHFARRYSQSERVLEKILRLAPDDQNMKLERVGKIWGERGNIDMVRAGLFNTPFSDASSDFVALRFYLAFTAREWQVAEQTLRAFGRDWFPVGFFFDTFVPREFCEGLIAQFEGDRQKADISFTTTVTRLLQKIPEQPDDPRLHSYLALTYAFLERKEEALAEVKRTVDRLKAPKTASLSSAVAWSNLITIYAWIGDQDKAIDELLDWAGRPCCIEYGDLKYSPMWDPLRNNPRFQKLLEEGYPQR
jgi:serine/threonine protein kinase